MSRLAEIYKQEVKSGGGVASTATKRLGEKLDPRQIFDRSGIIATMFPSLKSYSAIKPTKSLEAGSLASKLTPAPSLDVRAFSEISAATKLSAKNSMVLPAMARDMNLMRQNIAKMVKLQGGTAAVKGDMFFKRAAERESMFESAFAKLRGRTSPIGATRASIGKTRDGQTKQTALFVETSGLLDSLLGALGGKLGGAAAGAGAKLSGALAKVLPFLASATLPVLGIAGLAGLLYFLIKRDSGEAKTVDEMEKEGGYTPEQRAVAAPAPEPATAEELRKTRESMRQSEDPAVRAAAAELDRQDAIKALPDESEAERRRLGLSTAPEIPTTPTPVVPQAETVPSNVVVSGTGSAIMTGTGGYVVSGEPSTAPTPSPAKTAAATTSPTKDLSIGDAINNAASATGVSAQTLAIFGQLESSLGKFVESKTSSARGPFQFIESTWLSMLQKHGKKYGYDPSNMTKEEQLNLRYNNKASALMAAEYTKENAATLGINPSDPANVDELYLAHFLGPGGAKRVLSGQGLTEQQRAQVLKYNPNLKTGSNEEFIQFASMKTASAARVSAVQQIASAPSSGAVVATASSAVADGRRASSGGNVVIDNSQRTSVASSSGGKAKPASAYDKDIVDAIVSSSYA